jgi:hypothetical protein
MERGGSAETGVVNRGGVVLPNVICHWSLIAGEGEGWVIVWVTVSCLVFLDSF